MTASSFKLFSQPSRDGSELEVRGVPAFPNEQPVFWEFHTRRKIPPNRDHQAFLGGRLPQELGLDGLVSLPRTLAGMSTSCLGYLQLTGRMISGATLKI